jgi:hypothetical protein
VTWQPLERTQPRLQDGTPVEYPKGTEQWANDLYVVIKAPLGSATGAEGWHLSIRRQDRTTARDWRHFQRMKNQLCGPEMEGIELYPAESRLVDTANQYHVWVVADAIPIGFPGRLVLDEEGLMPGAEQRAFEDVDLQHGGRTSKDEYNAMMLLAQANGVRGADAVAAARLKTWDD